MMPAQVIETVVSLSFQVAVIVLVSEIVSRSVKSTCAANALWSTCLLCLAVLPLSALMFPHLRPFAGLLSASVTEPAGARMAPGYVMTSIWLAGAGLLAGRLVIDIARLMWLLRAAAPAPKPLVDRLRSELARENDSGPDLFRSQGTSVEILMSPSLPSPVCWQLQRPYVVLPASMLTLSGDEIMLIVRHELEHLRAGHPLLLFVQRIIEIVFWIHPAVWWASRQAERAREFQCDDATATTQKAAATYVRTLLRVLSSEPGCNSHVGAALPLVRGRTLIAQRAERLDSRDWSAPFPPESTWRCTAPLACAVAAALLLWVPFDRTASQRSVWSPWPEWSARVLQSCGIPVRDYEVDGHRLRPQELRHALRRSG